MAAVFLVGALAALHAVALTYRQHQYHRSARDPMQHVAFEIGLHLVVIASSDPGGGHAADPTS